MTIKRAPIIIPLVLLSSVIRGTLCSDEDRWTWSWNCERNKCSRSLFPVLEKDLPIEEHEEVCKLICSEQGLFWPLPTGLVALSSDLIEIHPEKIIIDSHGVQPPINSDNLVEERSVIESMIDVFKQNIITLCNNLDRADHARQLYIQIKTCKPDSSLNWETKEDYSLNITTVESFGNYTLVHIEAETIFGARHGLQTLFQTIVTYSINKKCRLAMPASGTVLDKPVFKHRGLLIDTSRHYLPVNTIKRVLDGMAQTKLNVLHWHATDSQSFPLKLPRSSILFKYGAYSMDEAYTVEDIKGIVDYAMVCGVRVIMEIDGPSHSGYGWQNLNNSEGSQVVCLNEQPFNKHCWEPPCGQLNPVNKYTYTVLINLYKDIFDIFQNEDVFHMGGDEVFMQCWRSSEEISTFLSRMGKNTSDENLLYLWRYYHENLLKIADELSSKKITAILWSSQLTKASSVQENLDKTRYIIQTWVNSSDPLVLELLKKGYRLIISTKDAWYLDHGFWGNTKYYQWPTVYENTLPPDNELVLGGEVLMWGEYVDDNVIDGKIWPRASATAERLWTNPKTKAVNATERFTFHRERLVKLGIKADAISSQFCTQSPQDCKIGYY